jgi:hypothetical protein
MYAVFLYRPYIRIFAVTQDNLIFRGLMRAHPLKSQKMKVELGLP